MDTRIAISSATTIIPATFVLPLSIGAVGDEGLTTYDLISHGQDVEGKNACYVVKSGSTSLMYGPAYQNSCIHSGSNEGSGGDTVWYNYAIASAGTIIDENTSLENPATNMNAATESICPKGWTLPNTTQIQAIGNNAATYVSSFSPVYGGSFWDGDLGNINTAGIWWGSTAYNGNRRRVLYYNSAILKNTNTDRAVGAYIRCVPKS